MPPSLFFCIRKIYNIIHRWRKVENMQKDAIIPEFIKAGANFGRPNYLEKE